MSVYRARLIGWFAAAILIFSPVVASAATATWNIDANGDWTTSGNWTAGGPPNGAGQIANLNFNLGGVGKTITLNTDQTVGILNVSDPNGSYRSYTLSGTNTLTLNSNAVGTDAQINKTHNFANIDLTGATSNGLNPNTVQDVIAVPIRLESNLTIRNNALGGSLLFSGPIGNDGTNRSVTVRGPNLGGMTPGNQGGKALVIFSTANSYGGTTSLSNGARLRIEHGDALGTGNIATIAGGGSGNSVSVLELAGGITVTNNVTQLPGADSLVTTVPRIANWSGHNTFAGSILGIGTGGGNYPIHSIGTADGDFFTFSGDIINQRTQNETRDLRLGGAGDGEVTGVIQDKGSTGGSRWKLIKEHAGTWTLSGDNTYTGLTTVANGTLVVSSLNSVVSPSASSSLGRPTTVADGTINFGAPTTTLLDGDPTTTGTLRYVGAGETTDRVVNLAGTTGGGVIDSSGTGALVFTSDFTATGVGTKFFTLAGSNTGGNTIGGAIVDNSGFNTHVVKIGDGNWVLGGNNTYTGMTQVSGGKLLINGNNSGTGGVTVNPNGTLGGTGLIAGAVDSFGTIAPGDDDTPGTLTLGGLTLQNGSSAFFKLDPTLTTPGGGINDLIDIQGTLTGFDATTVNIGVETVGGGNLAATGVWTLAEYDFFAGSGWPTFNIVGLGAGYTASLERVPTDPESDPFGPGSLLLTVSTATPGDFNHDGIVDSADYVVWRKDPDSFLPNAYETWRQNFGAVFGSGAGQGLSSGSAVPEPASFTLAGLMGTIALLTRGRAFFRT